MKLRTDFPSEMKIRQVKKRVQIQFATSSEKHFPFSAVDQLISRRKRWIQFTLCCNTYQTKSMCRLTSFSLSLWYYIFPTISNDFSDFYFYFFLCCSSFCSQFSSVMKKEKITSTLSAVVNSSMHCNQLCLPAENSKSRKNVWEK